MKKINYFILFCPRLALTLQYDLSRQLRTENRIPRGESVAQRALHIHSWKRDGRCNQLQHRLRPYKRADEPDAGVSTTDGSKRGIPNEVFLRCERATEAYTHCRHSSRNRRTVRPAPLDGDDKRHRRILHQARRRQRATRFPITKTTYRRHTHLPRHRATHRSDTR